MRTFELFLTIILLLAARALLLPAAGRGRLPSPVQPAATETRTRTATAPQNTHYCCTAERNGAFHGASLPLFHLQQPNHLMMQIFLTFFYSVGCVHVGLVMVQQSGLDCQPGRTQVLESRPGGWKENLTGLGGREQGAGDIQDVPKASHLPPLRALSSSFFTPNHSSVLCPALRCLHFFLLETPQALPPLPIQPSIPLHAHSLATRIQVWRGWGSLEMSLVTLPAVSHPP